MKITCAGCGIDSVTAGYTDDDPAHEDGSYHDGKFVCDKCYCVLIEKGMDVGSPEQLQFRASLVAQKR